MNRVLSVLMTIVFALTGCAGPGGGAAGGQEDAGGGGAAVPASDTLAKAVYPEFPQQPVMPEGGGEKEWDAYMEACDRYTAALAAIRGEGIREGDWSALNAFAAKSAPLALAGREGENAIYSPLSLWSALAMLARCADGDSRQQVLDAMGADSIDGLQEQASRVWQGLYTDDGLSSLIVANSVWLNSGMEGACVQDTLDALARKYYAGVYSVPMGTADADQAVTGWVKEQTNGLIGGDAPVVETDVDTLALLVSSLYYRAGWTDEFAPERTEEDVFTDAAGQESRVDFMHKTQNANFIRRDGYQAARLSARLGEMVFVLPDEGTSPESLLQNPEFLSRLEFYGDACSWGEVRWSVPRFDVDSDLNLKQALAAMGVTDLLDPDRADLSALTDLDAFLSDARQMARVKVDEEGVEAAAVTIIMEATSAMPLPPQEVCVMDLDRPFLFIIRTQDIPLFVGVVNRAA